MLPVNVEGVTWLATNYTTYNTPIIVAILAYVLLVLSFCVALIAVFFWFGLKDKISTLYFAIFVCCMILFLAIYYGEKKNRENFIPEPISYVVYIEDNADYKTLIQNYTIESEQDNLTTIVLKEN